MSSANEAGIGLGNGKSAEVKRSLGAVKEDLSGLGHDVANLASHVTSEARERIGGISSRAQTLSKDAFEQIQSQVRTKPGVALGVAAGLGVLIGLMVSSRRH